MNEETSRPPALRIGHVRGVTLTKWERIFHERCPSATLHVQEVADADQVSVVRDGLVDLCFVRLPIDRDGLHAIPLYEDQMVAWVAKDHFVAAADEITLSDLDDETVITELDATSVDRALAGAVLMVPMSIARGAQRRDMTYRVVVDTAPSPVALTWLMSNAHPWIEDFTRVVQGRRARRVDQPPTEKSRIQARTVARPQSKTASSKRRGTAGGRTPRRGR